MARPKKAVAKKKAVKKEKETDLEIEEPEAEEEKELSLEDLGEEDQSSSEEENQNNTDDWFKTGDEGYQEMLKQEAVAKARKEKGVRRFWLKPEEEAIIVFLDNPSFYVWEHEIDTSGGSWKTRAYLTCSKDMAPCAVCGDGHKSYYISYGTILDTRKYTNNEGDKVMQGKSLFGAKKNTMHRIMALIEKYGSLKGLAFKVKRFAGDREPKVGSDFEYKGKVNIEKQFGKDDSKAFDYRKILAHPTKDELKAYGISHVTFGSGDDIGEESDTDLSFL